MKMQNLVCVQLGLRFKIHLGLMPLHELPVLKQKDTCPCVLTPSDIAPILLSTV